MKKKQWIYGQRYLYLPMIFVCLHRKELQDFSIKRHERSAAWSLFITLFTITHFPISQGSSYTRKNSLLASMSVRIQLWWEIGIFIIHHQVTLKDVFPDQKPIHWCIYNLAYFLKHVCISYYRIFILCFHRSNCAKILTFWISYIL